MKKPGSLFEAMVNDALQTLQPTCQAWCTRWSQENPIQAPEYALIAALGTLIGRLLAEHYDHQNRDALLASIEEGIRSTRDACLPACSPSPATRKPC